MRALGVILCVLSITQRCYSQAREFRYWPEMKIANVTQVNYNITFECLTKTHFCASWRYKESDPVKDDVLTEYSRLQCTKTHELTTTDDFNLTLGDGFMDWYYDTVVQIYHDCNPRGDVRLMELDLEQIEISEEEVFRSFRLDLTEQGDFMPADPNFFSKLIPILQYPKSYDEILYQWRMKMIDMKEFPEYWQDITDEQAQKDIDRWMDFDYD